MINIGWIVVGALIALILLAAIVVLIKTGRADDADLDSAKLTVLAGRVVIVVTLLVAAATAAAWITLTSV